LFFLLYKTHLDKPLFSLPQSLSMALWGQHLTTGNPFHMTILCIIPLIKDWEKPGDLNKSSITPAPDTRPWVHRDALTTYRGQEEKGAGQRNTAVVCASKEMHEICCVTCLKDSVNLDMVAKMN